MYVKRIKNQGKEHESFINRNPILFQHILCSPNEKWSLMNYLPACAPPPPPMGPMPPSAKRPLLLWINSIRE